MSQLITTGTVARLLNVSADRVRQLERLGILEATRTESGIRLFDRASVALVVQARQEQRAAR